MMYAVEMRVFNEKYKLKITAVQPEYCMEDALN